MEFSPNMPPDGTRMHLKSSNCKKNPGAMGGRISFGRFDISAEFVSSGGVHGAQKIKLHSLERSPTASQ